MSETRKEELPREGEYNWYQGQLAEALIAEARLALGTGRPAQLSAESALMIGHALRSLIAKEHAARSAAPLAVERWNA